MLREVVDECRTYSNKAHYVQEVDAKKSLTVELHWTLNVSEG